MLFKNLIDLFTSNIIVYIAYILIMSFWYFCYIILHSEDKLFWFYLPYGIIALSFLFFNNKIIPGLIVSQISFYVILINYNLDLPFDNYFVYFFCQLICMPVTLLVIQLFNVTLGTGKKYRLDKTNIYHVFLIIFLSTILLGVLFVLSSIFYEQKINIFTFIVGNFLGGVVLIISIKLIVNLPNMLKRFVK